MKEVQGVISPRGENLLAELLDEKVKWKNPLIEAVDGKFFKILIKTIDNTFLDKIPQEWQNPLEPIIEAAIDKQWLTAGELIAQLGVDIIDVPWLDEESERLLFNSIIALVTGLIMAKVEAVRAGVVH